MVLVQQILGSGLQEGQGGTPEAAITQALSVTS